MLRPALICSLVLGAAACGAGEPPPEPSYELRGGLAHTMGLPLLIDTATVPPAYAEAERLYRTATTAYARRQVGLAAEAFLELGYRLKTQPEPRQAGAYLAARCVAYQNAGTAWLQAGQPHAARALLWAAEARDPDCGDSIAQVFRRVETALAATSSTSSTAHP